MESRVLLVRLPSLLSKNNDMTNRQQIEEIKDLISEMTSSKREHLTDSTQLGFDLGIDGDDAGELMQAYVQRFQVDMSEFNFDLHFGPEAAFNPFTYLFWRVFKPDELKFVPITIGDLAEAATNKKWRAYQAN